mgnify:CR=1 FL=1
MFTVLFLTWFGVEAEPNQTSVGIIYLGDLSEDQYGTRIQSDIQIWKSTAYYEVYYQGESFQLDLILYELDLDETLARIALNRQNRAYFRLSAENHLKLVLDLEAFFTKDVMDEINVDELISDTIEEMGRLIRRKSYALISYASANLITHQVDSYVIKGLSGAQLERMGAIAPITVSPYKRFSTLEALEIYPLTNEEMSMLATAMLRVSMTSNFTGFDFSLYPEDPLWAEFDYHVRILRLNRYDLNFFNNLNQPFTFEFRQESDDSLRVTLYGYPYLNQYQTEKRLRYIVRYSTINLMDMDFDETSSGVDTVEIDGISYYRKKIQDGGNGSVSSYFRIINRMGLDPQELRLFEVQQKPIPEIYHLKPIQESEDENDGA